MSDTAGSKETLGDPHSSMVTDSVTCERYDLEITVVGYRFRHMDSGFVLQGKCKKWGETGVVWKRNVQVWTKKSFDGK